MATNGLVTIYDNTVPDKRMVTDRILMMEPYDIAAYSYLGTDMSKFETANHLASWSGLRPRNDESNKKIKSRKITHGNVYLRNTIIQCAWAASRQKDCFFSRFSYHQTIVRRKNKMKVIVAVARKLLIAVWHVLHDKTDYVDFKPNREESANIG